jgi:hypothetical protein
VGGRRKLYNEVLHNLYASPNIVREFKLQEDEMDGACSRHGRNEYRISVGIPEVTGPLRRPRCRWCYNIKMDLRELWW